MSAALQSLAAEPCAACRPDSAPVPAAEAKRLLALLPGWDVVRKETHRLAATFSFPDFDAALAFAAEVGALAAAADHHPRLVVEWGRVDVAWWTHAIGGLHRNDFIMAARTSRLLAV